jgi:hypothetical protein
VRDGTARHDDVWAPKLVFSNGAGTGRYRVLAEANQWRNGFISRADVADFLVAQIENDDYLGKSPVLIN